MPDALSEYTYEYPAEQIAHYPTEKRDGSKLLVVRRHPSGGLPKIEDCLFGDLPEIAAKELEGYLWVRNRTRVLPARIFAIRPSGSRHEILLTEKLAPNRWRAFIRNIWKVKEGEILVLENSSEKIKISGRDEVEFLSSSDSEDIIGRLGHVPLPPYLERSDEEGDRERYQTVWATGKPLSAAAPTASLHFTDDIWRKILDKGISAADVFLNVGRGTFEPLRKNSLRECELHYETFSVAAAELEKIKIAKRVLAIGTTSCRVVEALAQKDRVTLTQSHDIFSGRTNLFIQPGYEFKKVESLLTNFHLPQSSLLVLVAVFAGSLSLIKESYRYALAHKYRLFSYGDASLWI